MSEKILNGRYKIIDQLGEGGFGSTYLAEDINLFNSHCVIKKLNPHTAEIKTAKRLFKREAYILSHLQESEQIPKLFGYFEEDDNCYLVEEYIRGKTLDKLLDKTWQQQEVVNFLREILLILIPLHEQNIIHRDIKPSNIMRREQDNKFVLIDFGAVKQIGASDSTPQQQNVETMIGTPGYSPGEQMRGKPSKSSDIYALGMTAFHLLTNINPSILERNEQDELMVPVNITIDGWLREILDKMVQSHALRRYQSAQEALDHLDEIDQQAKADTHLDRSISSTRQPAPPPEKIRRIKVLPLVLACLAAASIVLVAELIYPFIRPFRYWQQGQHFLDSRQPEAALEQFQKLINIRRRNSFAGWQGRGEALSMLGRYNNAALAYERALSLKPKNLEILNKKGNVLYQLRKYDEALAVHKQVLDKESDNVRALSGIGLAYIGLRQYDQASEFFDRAQKIEPDNPRIWLEEALAIESAQGYGAAQESYKEALLSYNDYVESRKNDPAIWTDRGFVLQKLQRFEDSIDSYNRALEIDKGFYEALLNKGNSLIFIGESELALEALNQASEIRPQDYVVWQNRGELLLQAFQDYTEALDSFNRSISLRRDFYPAWLGKGFALSELGRNEEALVAFRRATNLDPNDPLGWANMGEVLKDLGRIQEAIEAYNKAIELGFLDVVPARDELLNR